MTEMQGTVENPLNREPPVQDLISSFISNYQTYDRNHGPIPILNRSSHVVKVTGLVPGELSLTIHDLATAFQQHEVTSVLQCAGNRRHSMRTWIKEVDGVDWGDGAVMNCRWRGPRLRDVLLRAGVDEKEVEGKHVEFACHAQECQDDGWYGGSIELGRAMREDAEVVLALERNGEPLSPNNGAPVRIIVPGVAGARSVKWLDTITIQTTESSNFYQRHDYKALPPHVSNVDEAEEYWDKVPSLQDMPVNSVIAIPQANASVSRDQDGMLEVSGYALPDGYDGPVVKVEVSGDEGKSWSEAELMGERSKFSWVLWRARVRVERGEGRRILSRATDAGGNMQTAKANWNLRGVAYNGYGEARDLNIL